jgi:hypothetical protein
MLSADFRIGIFMDNEKNMKEYKINKHKINKNLVGISEVNKNLVCVLSIKNMV